MKKPGDTEVEVGVEEVEVGDMPSAHMAPLMAHLMAPHPHIMAHPIIIDTDIITIIHRFLTNGIFLHIFAHRIMNISQRPLPHQVKQKRLMPLIKLMDTDVVLAENAPLLRWLQI